jgi:hypothetical protein
LNLIHHNVAQALWLSQRFIFYKRAKMREENLLLMRPVLNIETAESSVIEQFQNVTLRPILKFQHDLYVALFRNYIEKRKNTFIELSKGQRLAYILASIKDDLKFKNRLLGVAIGHFTAAEFAIFSEHEAELTRRFTALVVQRLQSAVLELV